MKRILFLVFVFALGCEGETQIVEKIIYVTTEDSDTIEIEQDSDTITDNTQNAVVHCTDLEENENLGLYCLHYYPDPHMWLVRYVYIELEGVCFYGIEIVEDCCGSCGRDGPTETDTELHCWNNCD